MVGLFFILIKVIGGKIGIVKVGLLIVKSWVFKVVFEEFLEEFFFLG